MVGTAPNSSTRKEVFNENDYNSAKLGIQGHGVVSGGVAIVSGTSMYVTLGYCFYRLGGQTLYQGGVNLLLQSTTQDRIYLIGLTNGTWTSQIGTAADPNSTTDGYFERYTPAPPTQVADYLNIVQVYVPANATALTSDMLKDMRIMLPEAPPLPMPLGEGQFLTVTGGVPVWEASSLNSIPTNMVVDFTRDDCNIANVGSYRGDMYFKTRHAMLFDEGSDLGFIKLYDYSDPERPIELNWGSDWDNRTDYDLKQGCVKDLTDTIRITNTDPRAYRLVYIESVIPFTPKITTYIARDSTLKLKKFIPYRINTISKGLQEVVSIANSLYDNTVRVATNEEYAWSFPDVARVAGFLKKGNMILSVGGFDYTFRIEAYSHGKSRGQSGLSLSPTMDSTMVPQATYDLNEMDMTTFPFLTKTYKPRSGNFFFRLRDTKHNIVTNFANQRLHIKTCGMRRQTTDNGDIGDAIGQYLRVSLI